EVHVFAEARRDGTAKAHARLDITASIRLPELAGVRTGHRSHALRGGDSGRRPGRRHRRRPRSLGEQRAELAHLAGGTPVRHAGVPDQRVGADRAAADETRDLVSRYRTLLIARSVEVIAVGHRRPHNRWCGTAEFLACPFAERRYAPRSSRNEPPGSP